MRFDSLECHYVTSVTLQYFKLMELLSSSYVDHFLLVTTVTNFKFLRNRLFFVTYVTIFFRVMLHHIFLVIDACDFCDSNLRCYEHT